MNNAMRVQHNFLEQITFFATVSLVAGITKPAIAAGFVFCYCIGRYIFGAGYTMKGPNSRIAGAILIDIGIFGQIGLAIYAVVMQI
jgi:hypothetical protein